MKRIFAGFSIVVATIATPAWAASQTVTLSVPDMNCSVCPITVKKALTKEDGVNKVEASLEKKQAIVTFDDNKTKIETLTKAVQNAGFPATVRK